MGQKDVDWINLTQDMDKGWALVLWVPYNVGSFFTS